MRSLARWHVWLGWLVGLPMLMWTVTGLIMVARPIEVVRGEHLRRPATETLPPGNFAPIAFDLAGAPGATVQRTQMIDGRPVTIREFEDGQARRYDAATGEELGPVTRDEARGIVARAIIGGEQIEALRSFPADAPPLDFRRPIPVWQASLNDGTRIYVRQDTGEIAAVRTRWWRLFDTMWGLHIMDLSERENTHHPVLVGFTALAAIGTLIGCILMFRRRKVRARPAPASQP